MYDRSPIAVELTICLLPRVIRAVTTGGVAARNTGNSAQMNGNIAAAICLAMLGGF